MRRTIFIAALLLTGLAAAADGEAFVIREGEEWGVPLRANASSFARCGGSVIDVGRVMPAKPISETGRVIITADGRFAFENAPTNAIRFLCCPTGMSLSPFPYLSSRGMVSIYVNEMARRGYNMIRWHMSNALSFGVEEEGQFCTAAIDVFDWLIKCCRDKGIYIQMNVHEGDSAFGPRSFDMWGSLAAFDHAKDESYLVALYFSPKARANWLKACRKMLCHENPYTGIRPVDDPCLLLLEGQNEQEFAFNYHPMTPKKQDLIVGPYRKFLKGKYAEISAYNAKWGTKYASFDEIPCFGNANSLKEKNSDVNEFLYLVSVDLAEFYVRSVREMGFKGYMTNYDFVKHLAYHFIRRPLDYVGMHIYHDHPLSKGGGLVREGAYNRQTSCIGKGNAFFRTLVGTRMTGKPLVCSEYDQPFWNRYRYERAFVCPAYAAFHDIDSISCWCDACSYKRIDDPNIHRGGGVMTPFRQSADPLGDASEFLAWALYRRGDVSPATNRVRIVETRKGVYAKNPLSAPAPEQTALSLMTGIVHDPVEDESEIVPPRANEIVVAGIGGGKMRIEIFFTEAVGGTRDISESVAALKKRGFLPPDNLSDGKRIFQSSTGELTLDCEICKMTINAPRFQGMAAPAGNAAKMRDFEVVSHSRDGNLSLVAMDGMHPIREAKRLVLVRLTNALNTDMRFSDSTMTSLVSIGTIPALLRHSKFVVRISNRNAGALLLHPLNLEGSRAKLPPISPVAVEGEVATFEVDTIRDGNTVYYEVGK